ncbi:MAG: hypothetical protein KJ811_05175, partial [Candidatus Margulisbacteria bacterium]|nr:hypothetical protein [Candidatus Margulisiibacteriota bacterium]
QTVNIDAFKKYFELSIKALIEHPPTHELLLSLAKLEQKLALKEEALKKLQKKIKHFVFEKISTLIKQELFKKLNTPEKTLNFLLANKKSKNLLNLSFYNEVLAAKSDSAAQNFFDRKIDGLLTEASQIETIEIKELLALAQELGLEIQFPLAGEHISINKAGQIVLNNQQTETSLLLDELKLIEIKLSLETSLKNKLFLFIHKLRVIFSLQTLQATQAQIEETKSEARQVAWAKCIALLKELHLKRILTTSTAKFSQYSVLIKHYTLKSRKLGSNISQAGTKWVEAKLETLALQSAAYKLELLQSMQSLEYNKKREQDIKCLIRAVKHYQEKLGR